jgi:hypothetical protein
MAGATGSASGATDRTWTVTSPDGTIEVQLRLADGTLTYTVARSGRAVVSSSSLGLRTATADFTDGLVATDASSRRVSGSYETTSGKRLRHSYRARELTLTVAAGGTDGPTVEVIVRAFDGGVGLRYRLPADGSGAATVEAEATGFELPGEADAWAIPWANDYESQWGNTTTVGAAAGDLTWGTLVDVGDDWLLLGESDVDRQYPTTRPTTTAGSGSLSVAFPDGDPATASRSLETPWRVLVVGELGDVVESDLLTHLEDGSRVDDTSWIEPGRVAWSWWSDGSSPQSLSIQKDYVDYAAAHGWEAVLVDANWDPADIQDLIAYADPKGVDVIVWSHWTDDDSFAPPSGTGLDTARKRRDKFDRWSDWGVAGIKVDFMESDRQARMQFYWDLLADAADYELTVNLHGCTIPKGWRRQWPHLMTHEAVLGAEQYKNPNKTVTPAHNVALAYTRNVLGPMDYTPVTFSADGRETTDGHELALSVVYESGQQHFADSVDVYSQYPLAERVLDHVAAAWDETVFLDGHPDEYVVVARRTGRRWFLGCIAATATRVSVPLDFLESGVAYRSGLTRDGPTQRVADSDLVRTERPRRAGESVTVDVPAAGGFVLDLLPEGTYYLSDRDWERATNGFEDVERDASNQNNPLTLNGTVYEKGLGVHAPSELVYSLDAGFRGETFARFRADVGVDDEVDDKQSADGFPVEDAPDEGTVAFAVYGDGDRLWASGPMDSTSATQSVDVDVSDVDRLRLVVEDAGDGRTNDHADWAAARLVTTPVEPGPVADADGPPRDGDGDGLYEDVDGDGDRTYEDVVTLFEGLEGESVGTTPRAFDFNGNGRLDHADIVALFESI